MRMDECHDRVAYFSYDGRIPLFECLSTEIEADPSLVYGSNHYYITIGVKQLMARPAFVRASYDRKDANVCLPIKNLDQFSDRSLTKKYSKKQNNKYGNSNIE
jgi:hypothetical protein